MARWVFAIGVLCAIAHAENKRVVVAGNKAWTDTGVKVRQGDTLTLSSMGMVQSGGRQYGSLGATGSRRLDDIEAVFPLASAQPMALIARIDKGPAFIIGEGGAVIAPAHGTLQLGINDHELADNQGAWTVTISTNDSSGIAGVITDDAHPLEYSMWSHCSRTGTTDAVFVAGGAVEIADVDCRGAQWKLDGDRVSFSCSGTQYLATLSGDKLDGTWTSGARKGVVCMRRVDPSANPNAKKVNPSAKETKKRAGSKNQADNRNDRSDKRFDKSSSKRTARDENKPRRAFCQPGEHSFEGGCYSCPPNFRWSGGGTCRENCPAGWIEWKDQCVQCPAGTTWDRNGHCYEWRVTER